MNRTHHNNIVRVGLIQSVACEDTEQNLSSAVRHIRQAAQQGAQIVCLQELFRSLYFCREEDRRYFELAEPVPGATTEMLQALAAELGVVIIASLFERRAAGLYHNTAVVLDADGACLGKYRKNHIPDDPGFYEKFYFTPGDSGYQVFDTRYARIGVLVCWDQWFPEAARITALMGADVLFYPAAIGWDLQETSEAVNREQYEAWQVIQRSHAIANGVHVVAVNRTGVEAGTQFWGGSFVAAPFGTVLYQASHFAPEIHVQEIDLSLGEHYRTVWPFLRDRRTDTYRPIVNRLIDEPHHQRKWQEN
ncbi:MAG: carbon-nitrogen hydrolase [Bacteroidales bacterium]|jgi:N-carbamoylputrescine amidase|nr:carbon-nitrogen hydrolase [Bacteroidales bacterium]